MNSAANRVVLIIGAGFLLALAGVIALAVEQLPIPDVLVALSTGSLGALGGLLAPRPGSSDEGGPST